MSIETLNVALTWAQGVIGMLIMLGGLALSAAGVDGATRRMVRWAVTGLVCWGAWFAMPPVIGGGHDSLPALALAALVAYVLLIHGRQIRGILDGETWWPPNLTNAVVTVHMEPRRPPRPLYMKLLCPWWLLVMNDDDGYFGDPDWLAGRWMVFRFTPISWRHRPVQAFLHCLNMLRIAFIWWLRNPAHNLTWYGIGVADRERLNVGRWAPAIHPPGGGLLTCWTEVQVLGIWVALPFISYLSPFIKAYAGWRPSGAIGLKLNLSLRGSISLEA